MHNDFDLSISQYTKLYTIPDDAVILDENQDCVIGEDKNVTISIKRGETFRVADLYVLGTLTIQSQGAFSEDHKGCFQARDVIQSGNVTVSNVRFKCRYHLISPKLTKAVALDIVMDWFRSQRQEVGRMGIQPIFSGAIPSLAIRP